MSDDSIQVYVSYKQSVEKETQIVAALEKLCKEREIEFIRDQNELKHGELISQFMEDLSKSRHIIVVFSRAYFESEYCMFELLRIFQRGDFHQRIHPICVDDVQPSVFGTQLEFTQHWGNAVNEKKKELEDSGLPNTVTIHLTKRLKTYEDIFRDINRLMAFAGDMNITPLDELKKANFSPLLDRIKPKAQNHEENSQFTRIIVKEISQELNDDNIAIFRNLLKTELATVFAELGHSFEAQSAQEIAVAMIRLLELDGKNVPVVSKVLQNAAMHCFHRRKGREYAATKKHHTAIRNSLEQILGWLVLASINEDWLAELCPDTSCEPAIYFELPILTENGVEIIVSRHFKRRSEMADNHVLKLDASRFSWQEQATLENIKLELWNQVFSEEPKETYLSQQDVKKLNAELRIRRLDEWYTEHHYIALQCESFAQSEDYQNLYQQLLSELTELTLVRFGVEGEEQVFIINEQYLISAIERLLTNINRALAT